MTPFTRAYAEDFLLDPAVRHDSIQGSIDSMDLKFARQRAETISAKDDLNMRKQIKADSPMVELLIDLQHQSLNLKHNLVPELKNLIELQGAEWSVGLKLQPAADPTALDHSFVESKERRKLQDLKLRNEAFIKGSRNEFMDNNGVPSQYARELYQARELHNKCEVRVNTLDKETVRGVLMETDGNGFTRTKLSGFLDGKALTVDDMNSVVSDLDEVRGEANEKLITQLQADVKVAEDREEKAKSDAILVDVGYVRAMFEVDPAFEEQITEHKEWKDINQDPNPAPSKQTKEHKLRTVLNNLFGKPTRESYKVLCSMQQWCSGGSGRWAAATAAQERAVAIAAMAPEEQRLELAGMTAQERTIILAVAYTATGSEKEATVTAALAAARRAAHLPCPDLLEPLSRAAKLKAMIPGEQKETLTKMAATGRAELMATEGQNSTLAASLEKMATEERAATKSTMAAHERATELATMTHQEQIAALARMTEEEQRMTRKATTSQERTATLAAMAPEEQATLFAAMVSQEQKIMLEVALSANGSDASVLALAAIAVAGRASALAVIPHDSTVILPKESAVALANM